jgi:hypothetical protein
MELTEFAEIVENMALQHDYPGFEIRSLKLGLPAEVTKAPAKMFAAALGHDRVVVKLAALRWFSDCPGVAQQHLHRIMPKLSDADEWVRLEAVSLLGRMHKLKDENIVEIAKLLKDEDKAVRKEAAKALGKLGCKDPQVVTALKAASEDADTEVKWKAQKALRKLGEYAT